MKKKTRKKVGTPDVVTEVALNWEFTTRVYAGVCRLVKSETKVKALFFASGLKEFPDVCRIEEWFKQTVENDEWTAEELVAECSLRWGMSVTLFMTALNHGPIKVTALK